jgi:hypothetical protein
MASINGHFKYLKSGEMKTGISWNYMEFYGGVYKPEEITL